MTSVVPNIVIFGESGSGKSSIINMLTGGVNQPPAEVTNSALSETKEPMRYRKIILGEEFFVWDTPGLNEGAFGTVNSIEAMKIFRRLLAAIPGGVHLLVIVTRTRPITRTFENNYKLVYDVICQRKVPIILAITGMDREDERITWWADNKDIYNEAGIQLDGCACLGAVKQSQEDIVYNNSVNDLEGILHQKCSIQKVWDFSQDAKSKNHDKQVQEYLATMFGEKKAKEIIADLYKRNGSRR